MNQQVVADLTIMSDKLPIGDENTFVHQLPGGTLFAQREFANEQTGEMKYGPQRLMDSQGEKAYELKLSEDGTSATITVTVESPMQGQFKSGQGPNVALGAGADTFGTCRIVQEMTVDLSGEPNITGFRFAQTLLPPG